MTFFVDYFGCRANQAEVQEWIVALEEKGYRLVSSPEEAALGILNTCSVTARAERDVLRSLQKVYRTSHIPWLITGCTVTQQGEVLRQRYPSFTFVPNAEKEDLVARVEALLGPGNNVLHHSAFRSRIFLKVQDGCNFRCAYCIVPQLRGRSRSLKVDEVVAMARHYVDLGYREVVLSGVNLSSYGYDLFPGVNLLDLLKPLAAIEDLAFLRLSSLDPRYLGWEIVKGLADIPKLAPSFHFSFQSGSSGVLKRMNRGSKAEDYLKVLGEFRHFFPRANLGADLITGFPEETQEEHEETMAFLRRSSLNYLHIFPYSPRPGTRAAGMRLVPGHLVNGRQKELNHWNSQIRLEYRESFLGEALNGILVEEHPRHSTVITENFLTLRTGPAQGYRRRPVRVRLSRVVNETICEGVLLGFA